MTSVIPAPVSFELHAAAPLQLTEASRIIACGDGAAGVAETFAEQARRATDFELPVIEGEPAASDLSFVVADGEAPGGAAEGYTLESGEGGVRIGADTAAGLFRGSQTLRQLLPAAIERADAATAADAITSSSFLSGFILPPETLCNAARLSNELASI